MKLRLRSMASKETMKIEVPSDCNLPQLKEVISDRTGAASSQIILSFNGKDEIFGSPEETLRSLGVASGDLLFYKNDSNVLERKTVILGAEGSGSTRRVVSFDDGLIACGNSGGIGEVKAVEEPKEVRIEEDEKKLTGFGDDEMADVKGDETLDFEGSEARLDEKMDVELSLAVIPKRQSMSYFLKNVANNGLSGHSLLVAAVHAVLVESGFVLLDSVTGAPIHGLQFLEGRLSSAMTLSLRYTLGELIGSESIASEVVIVKLHKLGSNLVVYGALSGNKNGCYNVRLDEVQYAPKIEALLKQSSEGCESLEGNRGSENIFLTVLHEKEVLNFYKEVKDKLALPLLIDICDKAGLPQPPCLMCLPTELKLKIFEFVTGVDLMNLACLCSEFQYLTSDNSLWKIKCAEEFGIDEGSNSTNWKNRFVSSWKMAKKRKQASDNRLHMPRRHPRPFGMPFIIGGDYDLSPFGGSGPSIVPLPYSSFQPVRRSPWCAHGGRLL